MNKYSCAVSILLAYMVIILLAKDMSRGCVQYVFEFEKWLWPCDEECICAKVGRRPNIQTESALDVGRIVKQICAG